MSSRYTQKKADDENVGRLMANNSMFAFGTTFVAACALSAVARRFWSGYRQLPISAKTVLILAPSMGAFYIRGEQSALMYHRSKHMNQLDADEREAYLNKQDAMNRRANTMDRAIEYITKHRWSILGCTWLAGMSGSLYHLYRQKGMTSAQKAVQARMYAQAITIIGILSTAAIASLSDGSSDRH
ncbi:Replication factor C, subunit RFC4, partial [Coemansia erecta]